MIVAEPLLLTIGQAAPLLGVSPRHLYDLAAEGQLPVVQLGKRKLLRMEDVRAIAERGLPVTERGGGER